jgi:plasmid maintenance system antidote protein VapI
MTIFNGLDYKPYLKFRAQESRGNLTLLSKKAECQASYLLRVIHEEAQLTPDQAHRLSDFWMLEPSEREFFMTQVNLARSADLGYRAFLKRRLEEILKAQNNLKEVVQRAEVSDVQSLLEYHSDYRNSLTHFLTACPGFQLKSKLASRMNLSTKDLSEILNYLLESNLVSVDGERVKLKKGSGHIPRQSPVLPLFLNNWRQLAVQKSLKMKEHKSVHFTNVQTIGIGDVQKLIELSKQFIQKSKSICDESDSEDVIVVNLDVFVP